MEKGFLMSKPEIVGIRKSETKFIQGDKWKFDFRENGYVVVSKCEKIKNSEGIENVIWRMYFHGVDLEACMQYLFVKYGELKILHYDELEIA